MSCAEAVVVEQAGAGELLTAIVALGIYYEPADPEAGRRQRALTEIGTLLSQAKYWPGSPRTQEHAKEVLVGRLIATLDGHPLLRGADGVVAVPATGTGFSNTIAADLSFGLDLPVWIGRSLVQGGRPAKSQSVHHDYVVDEDLTGRSVVIFDDVYRSGGSLRAMATAAVHAGAARCCGLVIARSITDG